MGAWSQLGSRLLASAGGRSLASSHKTSFLSAPTGGRQLLQSSSGWWNRAAGADLGRLHPGSNGSQQQSIYGILGISAILLWGGARQFCAEEAGHGFSPHSAASTLNKFSDLQLQEKPVQESEPAEGVSNEHTAKWRVFTDMGRDLFTKGRLDESEKYLKQALEEALKGFGEKDPHVASSCTYLVQRKLDQARQCYERSLEIKEKELGKDHPEYANTMFHLGEVLRLQGKFKEAEKYIRDSIDILQEGGVGHNPVAIRRMGRLVEILSQTGQLKEAERLQRMILHNLELSQGVESSNSVTAAENLAATLQAAGKLEEAEELLQTSLETRQKLLPPTHVQVGVTMFKLASVAVQRGDELLYRTKRTEDLSSEAKLEYERAEGLLHRAIRIAERSWKPVSAAQGSVAMRAGPLISLLRSLDALGNLQLKKVELATTSQEVESCQKEAESLFRHCLSVLDKPGVSEVIASIPEFQRQHVSCLRHLVVLLTSIPMNGLQTPRVAEVSELLKKAEQIEAELRKNNQLRVQK